MYTVIKYNCLHQTRTVQCTSCINIIVSPHLSQFLAMMLHAVRRLVSPALARSASTLILVEHNGSTINPATLNTVTAAKKLGGPIHALVAGDACQAVCVLKSCLV